MSLRRLIGDALEDQLSLSSTLPRTLRTLLLQPGRITKDYLDGRIARYVPPLRLYLITSFVFFFVISVIGGSGNGQVRINTLDSDLTPDTAARPAAEADTVGAATARVASGVSVQDGAQDTPISDVRRSTDSNMLRYLPEFMRDRLEPRWVMLEDMSTAERQRVFSREFMARAPIAIFLLVPLFAGLLTLLYVRGRYYYVDHLIFAFHVHAFAFMLLTVIALTGGFAPVRIGFALWLVAYMGVAIRRVYGQSLPKSLGKLVLLAAAYLAMFGISMVGTLLATMLWMPL